MKKHVTSMDYEYICNDDSGGDTVFSQLSHCPDFLSQRHNEATKKHKDAFEFNYTDNYSTLPQCSFFIFARNKSKCGSVITEPFLTENVKICYEIVLKTHWKVGLRACIFQLKLNVQNWPFEHDTTFAMLSRQTCDYAYTICVTQLMKPSMSYTG